MGPVLPPVLLILNTDEEDPFYEQLDANQEELPENDNVIVME